MNNGTVRAEKMIYTDPEHKRLLVLAVLALMTCEEHGGIHHFAVVREGCALQLSNAGYQCLLDQGVSMDAPE